MLTDRVQGVRRFCAKNRGRGCHAICNDLTVVLTQQTQIVLLHKQNSKDRVGLYCYKADNEWREKIRNKSQVDMQNKKSKTECDAHRFDWFVFKAK